VRGLSLAALAVAALVTGRSARAGLAGWDGGWYVGIARHGYGLTHVHPDGRHLSDYAFFPLYPRWSGSSPRSPDCRWSTQGC